MSKHTSPFDFHRVDLPGRDVYRCQRTGKIIGDGKPFEPAELYRLGNVIEPTPDVKPELPEELRACIEAAEANKAEALAAVERASETFFAAKEQRDREYARWASSSASIDTHGVPPKRLKPFDDHKDTAWNTLEEARAVERVARVELTRAQQAAARWRTAAAARERAAERPAPTLRERLEALGARPV